MNARPRVFWGRLVFLLPLLFGGIPREVRAGDTPERVSTQLSLIASLEAPSEEVRQHARDILIETHPFDPKVIGRLVQAFAAGSREAGQVLEEYPPSDPELRAELASSTFSDPELTQLSARILSEPTPHEKTQELLVKSLSAPSRDVRRHARDVLLESRPGAPRIQRLIVSAWIHGSREAGEVLEGFPLTEPRVLALLASVSDRAGRKQAVRILQQLPPPLRVVTEQLLVQQLSSPSAEEQDRRNARELLAKLGPLDAQTQRLLAEAALQGSRDVLDLVTLEMPLTDPVARRTLQRAYAIARADALAEKEFDEPAAAPARASRKPCTAEFVALGAIGAAAGAADFYVISHSAHHAGR